jgi:hypothetical protein
MPRQRRSSRMFMTEAGNQRAAAPRAQECFMGLLSRSPWR